jgi:lysozyme family protein
MKDTWSRAYDQLMEHEGGFTDDPRDPGNHLPDGRPGCTNLGITQKAWEAYVGHKVTHEDMKALTREIVEPFYKKEYWTSTKGDDLPYGIDYMVFDMGVNSGPGRAAMTLQKAVGTTPDGAIGPKTLAAVRAADQDDLIKTFSKERLEYMESLKNWETYKNGWTRRVNEVATLATSLARA